MNNEQTTDYSEPWSIKEERFSTSVYDGKGKYFADVHQLVGEDNSVAWFKAERVISCVNSCVGIADPAAEIEAMREAIQKAHSALDGCIKYMLGVSFCNLDLECETMDKAHHALAKLQPFIKQ